MKFQVEIEKSLIEFQMPAEKEVQRSVLIYHVHYVVSFICYCIMRKEKNMVKHNFIVSITRYSCIVFAVFQNPSLSVDILYIIQYIFSMTKFNDNEYSFLLLFFFSETYKVESERERHSCQ